MKNFRFGLKQITLAIAAGVVAATMAGCGGSSSAAAPTPAPAPPPVTPPPPGSPVATSLEMAITSVSINTTHSPVVNFTVTYDKTNARYPGLQPANLRFNIAKLSPGANGDPSTWQNYISATRTNTTNSNVAFRGSTETPALLAVAGSADASLPGSLVDYGDGTYTYTFLTDLTDAAKTCPPTASDPAPCKDANGKPLDVSYQPDHTHRVGMYVRTPLPASNATFDFRPDGNTVTLQRDIVTTAKCNECHEQLNIHGGRIDTKLCVTCHNPGSWEGITGNTVDFKVFIHKVHRGENLPSVVAGGSYAIGTDDFSNVVFPQEIRNCTKCHDGTSGAANATPQGDYWKTDLSIAACGSCHDNIDFAVDGSATYLTTPVDQRVGHSGGVVSDNSQCITCHVTGKAGGSVQANHNIDESSNKFVVAVQRAKFKFNILKICGTAVASDPVCAPGTVPTVTFSVTDPTGGTHGYPHSTYSLFADPEFWDSTAGKASGSMSVDIAWDTLDYNNTGGQGARPARANAVNVFGTTATASFYGNPSIAAYARATDNGDGTYTVTALGPIPDGTVFPNIAASGSGVVAIEGRALGAPLVTIPASTAGQRLPIKAAVAYFGITDTTPVERRVVVDATTKCDRCHDQLSLHGGSRNDNVQLCVICHNPNMTDVPGGARHKFANGLSDGTVGSSTPPAEPYAYDGKKEESVDFKRMIHAIHAGAVASLDGTTALVGMRDKGIVISGADFSDVRFPGVLSHCTTCHVNGSYKLADAWEQPAQNGIQGSALDTTPGLTDLNTADEVNASLQDPRDDHRISPTAAVCSSCHDTALEQAHMKINGAVFPEDGASSTQANLLGAIETCTVCHGPGALADVDKVHGVPP